MAKQMTYGEALRIAYESLERYKQAETKADIETIFIKYGREGIGYRPLCRMFFSGKSPEEAVKVYSRE